MQTFYSPGKLLISGEYVVLSGSEALAIATKFGQKMIVKNSEQSDLIWNSFNHLNSEWFQARYRAKNFEIVDSSNEDTASQLKSILVKAFELNPNWNVEAHKVETYLEFPLDWGLGSSSTLICNIAKWAEVGAFELSQASFGGSGYDIAVGMVGSELIYSYPPAWEGFVWNPPFRKNLFFVHLNKKQNSRESIASFEVDAVSEDDKQMFSAITRRMVVCEELKEFEHLINAHEEMLSGLLGRSKVKDLHFSDYPHAIKSLGAWGGDFVLAVGNEQSPEYFRNKGFDTILSFEEMVLT
ncbi:MAG: GHMP kinase [Bacteroidia bacterium]